MRWITFAALCSPSAGAAGELIGEGVWQDPQHYLNAASFAGLRYIATLAAEGRPSRVPVRVIGSDDGATWWTVEGVIALGASMTMTLDFSPKGGPLALNGTLSFSASVVSPGPDRILWLDGNSWSAVRAPTSPLPPPGPGTLDDHVGAFLDGDHLAGTFAGMRFVAEDPPHELKVIGTDDGKQWWFANGSCGGPEARDIRLSMPSGQPDRRGRWVTESASSPARIEWGGEAAPWTKVSFTCNRAAGCPAPDVVLDAERGEPRPHFLSFAGAEAISAAMGLAGLAVVLLVGLRKRRVAGPPRPTVSRGAMMLADDYPRL